MKPKIEGWIQYPPGTKPDRFHRDISLGPFVPVHISEQFGRVGWICEKVCLVSPELLEWVEKARSHFQEAEEEGRENWDKLSSEDFQFDLERQVNLLAELEKILPEEE